MFASDRILALNIGASKLALAEFRTRGGQPPEMLQYGVVALGIDPDSTTDPSAYIVSALRDLMREKGIHPAPLLMTLSGQAVLMRFAKLPPVARDKLQQLIAYETEQNVPFPIGEVIWDYQLVGDAEAGEQNVMIVAVKTESVTEMTDSVQAAGLEPEIVDVAPLALYNCVRFNYPELDGCTMVLDIGARSTNLVFIEEGRIFSRSIPVAGNTITQELAKSFQLDFRTAERMKREHAFVALGGVYAVTDDETSDRVSKVVRNVVTRLHAEVNRSINFYRSQQGGSVPKRVFLTGGSSIIPHMDTFFREKLKVEVDFLNPFERVNVGGRADPEKVGEDFYELGEVVGLALRRGVQCPVSINLMPPNLIKQKTFRRRIPFFITAAAGVVLTLLTWAMHGERQLGMFERQRNGVSERLEDMQTRQETLSAALRERASEIQTLEALRRLVESRTIVAKVLVALRDSLYDGMWLTSIEPKRSAEGEIARLSVSGKGFSDKLRQVERAELERGGKATAVELLRDRLSAQPLFGDDVKIIVEREEERYPVRVFTLEVGLEEKAWIRPAGAGK